MTMKINKEIFENNKGLIIGIVEVKGIDNSTPNPKIQEMLDEIQQNIKQKYNMETLTQEPKLDSWRQAYMKFGAKPKTFKPSVEALYRMTLKDVKIGGINKVVDIYNYISLKHMVPVGGDDADKVQGEIELTYAKGNEKFELLGSKELQTPQEGEVIYKDDFEVLCRRWNWRECDKSKMTADTKNICLVVEGLPPVVKEEMGAIIQELAELVVKFCGGIATVKILDQQSNQCN